MEILVAVCHVINIAQYVYHRFCDTKITQYTCTFIRGRSKCETKTIKTLVTWSVLTPVGISISYYMAICHCNFVLRNRRARWNYSTIRPNFWHCCKACKIFIIKHMETFWAVCRINYTCALRTSLILWYKLIPWEICHLREGGGGGERVKVMFLKTRTMFNAHIHHSPIFTQSRTRGYS